MSVEFVIDMKGTNVSDSQSKKGMNHMCPHALLTLVAV